MRFERNKSILAIAALLLLGLLSGCITTTTGGFTEKASSQRALEKRVSLARQYIGEGNWEDAKRNLQLANGIDPNNAEVHEIFGLVYQNSGEYELADEHYRSSIKFDRACSRCRNNYAAFLYSQQEYAKAESQLEYVVKDSLYTARSQAFLNLGLCRLRLDKMEEAQSAFERTLAMDRTNEVALLELALLRFNAEDVARANRYYDSYKRVTRQQSPRGLLLGIRLAQATDDHDAEASYKLALSSLYPDSVEYQIYQRAQQGD